MNKTKSIRTLGIIPARGGSKGIPYKNIAPLAGKPLIYWTISSAQKAKRLDCFLVSTDDPKIAAVARSFGADVPFLRPKKIAQSNSTDIEFLQHAVEWVEKKRGWQPEYIVLLKPTSPFRTSQDIDIAIDYIERAGCDSVRTVHQASHSPYKMWHFQKNTDKLRPVLKTKYFAQYATDVPRQWLEPAFQQDSNVDITRTKFIKKGKVWGKDVRGIVVPENKAIDIDTPLDLELAEFLIDRGVYKI